MGENKKKYKLISIIDDDDTNNYLCEKVINSLGISEKVRSYLNGREALNELEKALEEGNQDEVPSYIFLDINMPVMNGWEFLDVLEPLVQKHKLPTKVAILSSSVFQKDKDKASKYKVVIDYISKPLSIAAVQSFFAKENG